LDPSRPADVGVLPDLQEPRGLWLVGQVLYVAVGGETAGLQTFDVTDPARPRPIGFVEIPFAQEVVVDGTRAFVRGIFEINVVDVTDPTRPVRQGGIRTRDARLLAVVDGYLYASYDGNLIRVIDVSNPAQPEVVANFGVGQSQKEGFGRDGRTGFITTQEGVLAVDLTNPRQPSEIGLTAIPPVASITVAAPYLFAGRGSSGLWIYRLPGSGG
jgi:hypothetical protein